MGNAMLCNKGTKRNELSTIVRVEMAYFMFELGFDNRFEGFENGFDIRLFSERKKPSVLSEVVN